MASRSVALCCFITLFALSSAKQVPQSPQKSGTPTQYDLDLNRLPENVAVHVNSEVTLSCAIANTDGIWSIQWWEYVTSSLGVPISDNGGIGEHPHRDRYEILHRDDAEYSLRISPVLFSDAGLYQCINPWGNPAGKQRHGLQLTVVAEALNCTTTLPPTGIVLEHQYNTNECTLEYRGNIIPNMTWSGLGPFDQAYIATPTHIWAGMQYSITRNMNAANHLSDTFFSPYFLPVDQDSASNVPTLTFTHRERQMFVYWGPQGVEAHPTKDYYEVGDIIVCTADGRPDPTFQWTNMRTGEITIGSEVTVDPSWLGFDQILRCETRNEIADSIYSANLFLNVSVPIPTTTTPTTTTPAPTLPPAVARCGDLTGGWESSYPAKASFCIVLDTGRNGYISGLARNQSDSWWVDVVGRAHSEDFDQLSFSGIQPLDFGVTSIIGECHRCFGVERILAHITTRGRGLTCGNPGGVRHTDQYEFYRSNTLNCPNLPRQTAVISE